MSIKERLGVMLGTEVPSPSNSNEFKVMGEEKELENILGRAGELKIL